MIPSEHMLGQIVGSFIVWKAIVLFFAAVSAQLLPLRTISIAQMSSIGFPYLQWIWGNFDGVNYISIAHFGYQYPNYAFFPLYPLLITTITHITGAALLHIALLLSNASLLFSLFFLYKIARLDFNEKLSFRAVVLLLAFPTAFFYGAVYADSLYLLLSLVSFYAVRKSQWFPAGLFGAFAGATRLVGIVLLPALLIEWFQQKNYQLPITNYLLVIKNFIKDKAFFLFLIPLGGVGYSLYLELSFGDFLLFQKAMKEWGQAQTVIPFQTLFRYLKIFVTAEKNLTYFVAVVEFIATIGYFALSAYTFLKIRKSYGLVMFLTLLIPTFTGTLQSMPRYFLHAFPTFIALSIFTQDRKKIFWGMLVVFVILQFVFVAMFTRGYFIA